MSFLQKSLLANIIFSTICAFDLVFFTSEIAYWFGTDHLLTFALIGFGLFLFAGTLVWEFLRQRPKYVLGIILQDLAWVLGSIILLTWQPFIISPAGSWTIAGVALMVFILAAFQFFALMRMDLLSDGKTRRLSFQRMFSASSERTWEIISQVDQYHVVAPNIDQVEILSGFEKGTVRRCTHQGDSWTETCTMWEEGKRFSFEVDTQTPDYPYPFSFLQGTWSIDDSEDFQTSVQMDFEFRFRQRWQALIYPLMRIRFEKVCDQLLDNWQKQIEWEESSSSIPINTSGASSE